MVAEDEGIECCQGIGVVVGGGGAPLRVIDKTPRQHSTLQRLGVVEVSQY